MSVVRLYQSNLFLKIFLIVCQIIRTIIIYSINKHLLIGPDEYPLESIKLHIAWFAGRDVAKHMARGDIAWLTGSDVRTSSNFAWSIRNVNGFNGIR